MNWGSASEFFAMGGYAWYVWGSYGVTFGFMLIETILLIQRKKSLTKRILRLARMNRGERV
jgi:heme exporter protein D